MAKVLEGGIICEPLDCIGLTPEFVKKAKEELHEDPERRAEDIQKFRKMILAESDLNVGTDDTFLLRFLRARKFNFEKALRLLHNFHNFRTTNSIMLEPLIAASMAHAFQENNLMFLPYRTQKGSAIILIRFGNLDPSAVPFEDGLRAGFLSLEKAIKYDATQVNGCVLLADMAGLGWKQMAPLIIPSNMRLMVSLQEECFPIRLKAIHIVFESPLVDILLSFARPFYKKKIDDRIYFHGDDLASLHQHIPPGILPVEYGGDLDSIHNSNWYQILLADEEEDTISCMTHL